MDKYGFFSLRACVPVVKPANPEFNAEKIISDVISASSEGVDCIVFPELSVTGYTCADLFSQNLLLRKAEEIIGEIAQATKNYDIFFAVGAPIVAFGKKYNCAVLINKGKIWGIVPKTYLPNYNEFYEKRWFESGKDTRACEKPEIKKTIIYSNQVVTFGTDLIFCYKGVKIGIEICEDLWVPAPPSCRLSMAGAEVILNLSASDDLIGKQDYLISLISQQSARCRCVYVYSSAGWGESSTDLVFSGKAMIGVDGEVFTNRNRFMTGSFYETQVVDIEKLKSDRTKFNTFREYPFKVEEYTFIEVGNQSKSDMLKELPFVNPHPFVPGKKNKLDERCEEIINIQAYGLMKRLDSIGCRKAIVGISGGLDSTLALLLTVTAFDKLAIPRSNIIGVTMPGLATTRRTKSNSILLMEALKISSLEIPIGDAVAIHFRDIAQNPQNYDATYENSQARERTQILMDLANKENGIVIGTGDMSELALGWCTYNGDQMSMYGVNASVPKTLVKHLVEWFATKTDDKTSAVLRDICETPISPELVPSQNDDIAQKTEDLVGPYELHDFFLYHFLRNSFEPEKILYLANKAFEHTYPPSIILKWLKVFIRRFFNQQFKRSCMPDGPKVGSVNLSPRGDWRMPSDASCTMWLKQLEDLESK